MADKLLRKGQAGEALGVSRPTIDRLIARGDLSIVRVSERAVRISESSIRAYVESRTERRAR